MISPSLTPTALVEPADRPPLVIRPARRVWRFRGLENLARLSLLLLTLGWLWLRGRLTGARAGAIVRTTCERLGGLWVKTGQLMALRIDLFSVEFCDQLARLQYNAVGFPTDTARSIIERELLVATLERASKDESVMARMAMHLRAVGPGASDESSIGAYFDQFDDQPIAVASIGQVFRARLRQEQVWVAVKVQRPYIDEMFRRDFAAISRVTAALDFLGIYPHMRWRLGLRELQAVMDEEIDYHYEAAHLRRMRRSLKAHKVHVPKVFRRYSTKRILVTEFVEGVLMADVIRVTRTDPQRLTKWMRDNDVQPRRVASRLLLSLFRQMLEDNTYHGDLHPGNIMLLRNSQVALLDFGTTSFTEREHLERFRLFVQALAQRDYSKAADMCFLMMPRVPNIDLDEVKEQLVQVLRSWSRRTMVRELPYHLKSLENVTVGIVRVLHEHRCTTEWAFLRFHRAFTTLDMSLIYLYPDVDYPRMLQRHFAEAELRSVQRVFSTQMAIRTLGAYRTTLDIQERLGEYTLFQGNIVRRHAQLLEGATNKFARFMASMVMSLALAGLLLDGLAGLVFLAQRRPETARLVFGASGAWVVDHTPRMGTPVWLAVMIAIAFFSIRLGRAAVRLREREAGGSRERSTV
ncbi:MAG TPA: AarF/ABC1/UbiB kinase family protein [Vicinamibacterales bacterium]|nr:AarF/ABC1/UbiB kinase family protein [Vicinamibacterales bacterium]